MAYIPPAFLNLFLFWVVAQTTHADFFPTKWTSPSVPLCRCVIASTLAFACAPPHGSDANGEIKISEPYGYDANDIAGTHSEAITKP